MGLESFHEPLTERELKILSMVSDDLTNTEIAQRLVLAVSTVKWHLRNIYGKLGVHNRSEAVTFARQVGFLQLDLAVNRSPHNLPAPATRFIGRTTELAEIGHLLETPSTRLVTIHGLGGMGKTRLALRCAEAQLLNYSDGVFYVSLTALRTSQDSSLASADLIATSIANALNITLFTAESPQQQVVDVLLKKNTLLVIDNCEHLLDGISFLANILTRAPHVKILATSRERLRLSSETVFNLRGLEYPEQATTDAIDYPAVELFIESARRTQHAFEPDTDDLRQIIRVCHLVNGTPLGIQLAAGWCHLLTVEEIAQEIAADLDFLETDKSDVPPRLRSVRVVFNYSWNRLTEAERTVFMKLSIFRGGFTREAAQTITGAALKTLSGLTDHSLIWQSAPDRYDIHELLRQYAHEHLEVLGEIAQTLDTHSHYYLDFISQREEDIKGRRQLAALDEVEADFENIRGAWEWALKREFYDALYVTAEALLWFGSMRGHLKAALDLFEQAQARIGPTKSKQIEQLWARVTMRSARLRIMLKDYTTVREDLALCHEITQQYDNPAELACCLWLIGNIEQHKYNTTVALTFYEQCLALYKQLNDRFYIAEINRLLAWIYQDLGEPLEIAIEYARQSLDLMRQTGNEVWIFWPLWSLGCFSLLLGEASAARNYFREAYDICRNQSNTLGTAWAANSLSRPAVWSDDLEQPRRLAEEAFAIATTINHPGTLSPALSNLGYFALIDGEYRHSEKLFKEALPLAEYRQPISNIYRGLGFLMCSQARFVDAGTHLADALKFLDESHYSVMTIVPLITLIAVIVAHQGDRERAVQWLGCADFAANDTVRWLQKLPVLKSLFDEMKAELDPDIYARSWKRGQQLDLYTVWAKVQAEIKNWK